MQMTIAYQVLPACCTKFLTDLMYSVFCCYVLYTQASQIFGESIKIDVGVTLIWRKAIAVIEHNSFRSEMALFKFGELQIISQIKHTTNYSAYMVY